MTPEFWISRKALSETLLLWVLRETEFNEHLDVSFLSLVDADEDEIRVTWERGRGRLQLPTAISDKNDGSRRKYEKDWNLEDIVYFSF